MHCKFTHLMIWVCIPKSCNDITNRCIKHNFLDRSYYEQAIKNMNAWLRQGVGLKTRGSCVQFTALVMFRSIGQTPYSTLPRSTQLKWIPSAQIQGWINSCRLQSRAHCHKKGKVCWSDRRIVIDVWNINNYTFTFTFLPLYDFVTVLPYTFAM